MGEFGPEFVRVELEIGVANLNNPRIVTDKIVELVQRLYTGRSEDPSQPSRPAGGFLYFAPFNYVVGQWPAGFEIPPNVTLYFCPGAVLTLGEIPEDADPFWYNLVIRGSIKAGLQQIFGLPFDETTRQPRGRIILEGDAVPEVYPEWWGALPVGIQEIAHLNESALALRPDTSAIQAAIDAAYNDRRSPAPLPIVLSGRYRLDRPLYFGQRPGEAPDPARHGRPFILKGRGAPEGTTRSGFHAGEPFQVYDARRVVVPAPPREDRSLVIVRGPTGFLIEDLVFDARTSAAYQAYSCLRVERPAADTSPLTALPSRVRRCMLSSGIGMLVQLGAFQHPIESLLGPPGGPRPSGDALMRRGEGATQDLGGLIFDGCYFNHVPANMEHPYQDVLAANSWCRDGVYFRATETRMLEFINCWLFGRMRAAIRTYGSRVVVTDCNFNVQRLPLSSLLCEQQDSRYQATGGVAPSRIPAQVYPTVGGTLYSSDAADNGAAFYLEWPGSVSVKGARRALPWPGLYVRGADVQSWRLLSTFPLSGLTAESEPASRYDVLLENTTLSLINAPVFGPFLVPPGILWSLPSRPGTPTLTLEGCLFNSLVDTRLHRTEAFAPAWAGRVVFEGPAPWRVVDLGARADVSTEASPFYSRTTTMTPVPILRRGTAPAWLRRL